MFSRCFQDVCRIFPGCLQDFSRMFSGCSDGSYWPGGIWWSFQMKVRTLKIQRNPMIPNYLMIPAAAIWWSPDIRWSIRCMDFDNPKVYGDTSITDGLVFLSKLQFEAKEFDTLNGVNLLQNCVWNFHTVCQVVFSYLKWKILHLANFFCTNSCCDGCDCDKYQVCTRLEVSRWR